MACASAGGHDFRSVSVGRHRNLIVIRLHTAWCEKADEQAKVEGLGWRRLALVGLDPALALLDDVHLGAGIRAPEERLASVWW